MKFLGHLRFLPVVLGIAAGFAALSTTIFGDSRPGPAGAKGPAQPDGARLAEDLAITKFSKLPAITYQSRSGDVLFAWQIKPTVEAQPARSRDVLVLVDTSASQAGRPLQQARRIVSALGTTLGADDRISIWTVNTPAATRSLTKEFVAARSPEVQQAANILTEVEYGSGATDFKAGLAKALATLAPDRGRQQIVLLLGDGESSYDPLTEDDRHAIGGGMEMRDAFFFAVPLGVKVNPGNLHGLASITGGSVVRVQEDLDAATGRSDFMTRLVAAFDVPVVKVEKATFGNEVGAVFPAKLPPLRADRTTLVMGQLAKPAATTLSLSVKGSVNTRVNTYTFSQAIPAPQTDNYFLNLMFEQWRAAPHKDLPAMLQSDRALALASTQVKLYRDEFLYQASWAISMDRFEDAGKLFQAALKIDPTDRIAAAGLETLDKLMTGKIKKADLEKKVSVDLAALKKGAQAGLTVIGNVKAEDPPAQPGNPAPGAAANLPAGGDQLQQTAARIRIEEQRYKVLTDATIRRARQLLRTDPDQAYQDLKRQREEILSYSGIGENTRLQLSADLEAVMREIFTKGAEIKRQAESEREAVARTRQRLNEFDRTQDDETRLQNRIGKFHELMQEARFELAYQEAQQMIAERTARGQAIPTAASASYIIGQQATQLREWKELVRIREDRFLLALMQTEKAHIPYPDEPPVHFPPAAVWRELTSLRREAYKDQNLGPNPSPTQKMLKDAIENKSVEFPANTDLSGMTLIELLNNLTKQTNVPFIIMDEYFKAENMGDIKEKHPTLASTQVNGLKLGTFLDLVLSGMNATFLVRPDYVEITTFDRRLEEKALRVFPVADLVIPIPDTVSQQQLQQTSSIQNSQLAIFGAVLGAQNFLGGGGGMMMMGMGGGMGGMQGGIAGMGMGGGMGGMGMGGQMAGQMGAGGMQGMQGAGGMQGMAGNFQGQLNLGVGGGQLGITGGQLGQFGNLGGQFGLQGGDQSKLLTNLIVQVVAKGEWSNVPPPRPLPGQDVEETTLVPPRQLNSLGYYPPARALIIRGTSRYHSNSSVKLKSKEGGQAAAPGDPKNGAVADADDKPADPNAPQVAIARDADGRPLMNDPNADPVALKQLLSKDPKKMWSQAIDWTITDPGVIVACADFLIDIKEYADAVEILKGGMRKGLTTDPWAHESLALALELGHGSPDEVERAALSAIDLDPADPKGYIKAAKMEAQLKHHDQAVAFCKRAASIDPDQPVAYANALAYAEQATELRTDAVVWAARNLLKRDWNAMDIDYHKQVNERLPGLIKKLEAAGQKADPVRQAIAEQTQRDLVIELVWQGQADLDLIVTEPSGSVCSATQKRTTGGGVLKGDVIDQVDAGRSEVYTAAMAFNGAYQVSVKKVMGRPLGDKASLKVWRLKGTPRESFDLIPIDLAAGKPVEVKLAGGSRTELATVAEENEFRAGTTGAPLTRGFSGMGGGVGAAGSLNKDPVATSTPQGLPLVAAASESRLPGIGAAADLRASVKLNPDRQTLTYHVNPVFGTGKEVAMPKVPLLPGGDQ